MDAFSKHSWTAFTPELRFLSELPYVALAQAAQGALQAPHCTKAALKSSSESSPGLVLESSVTFLSFLAYGAQTSI